MARSSENSIELNESKLSNVDDFGQLYDSAAESVVRYFFLRTGFADTAADLTAETFASALGSLASYDPSRGSPQQWLFGIASNQLARFLRRRRVDSKARRRLGMRPTVDLDSVSRERIEELVDLRAAVRQLEEALETLSPKVAQAVKLRVGLDMSYPDVAAELGISETAARARVSRGLSQLAERFEEES